MRVGILGEDPNDTASIIGLLQKKYSNIRFVTLLRNIRGWQLDNPKAIRTLEIEFKDRNCDFVVYLRDLDSHGQDKVALAQKQAWFAKLDQVTNGEGILLLSIYELEALLLADIETFNSIYKTSIKFPGDPSKQRDPKEFLMEKTSKTARKYKESDCPAIFPKLDFNKLVKRCSFFSEFVQQFDAKVA